MSVPRAGWVSERLPAAPYEVWLGTRPLRRRSCRSPARTVKTLTLAGVALGVAALVVVLAVVAGFEQALLEALHRSEPHLAIRPLRRAAAEGPGPSRAAVLGAVERASEAVGVPVVAGVARVEGVGLLRSAHGTTGVRWTGDGRLDGLVGEPRAGGGAGPLQVGADLAERLDITVGDRVVLLVPGVGGVASGPGRLVPWQVTAVVPMGSPTRGASTVRTSLAWARSALGPAAGDAEVAVWLLRPFGAPRLRTALQITLGGAWLVEDWTRRDAALLAFFQLERVAYGLVVAMISLVAALNVLSSFLMTVSDRGRELAILRTMGARRRSVLAIVVTEGGAGGLVGATTGALLGVAIAASLGPLTGWLDLPQVLAVDHVPTRIVPARVAAIAAAAFLLSVASVVPPAWWAARLDPVGGLRHAT